MTAKEEQPDIIDDVLRKVASGEMTPKAAKQLLSEKNQPNRSDQPWKAAHRSRKRRRGRPPSEHRKDNMKIILTFWVLYSDKLPKMLLRRILADSLNVDESTISRAIARLNKLELKGHLIGRAVVDGVAHVIGLSPDDVIEPSPNKYASRLPLMIFDLEFKNKQ